MVFFINWVVHIPLDKMAVLKESTYILLKLQELYLLHLMFLIPIGWKHSPLPCILSICYQSLAYQSLHDNYFFTNILIIQDSKSLVAVVFHGSNLMLIPNWMLRVKNVSFWGYSLQHTSKRCLFYIWDFVFDFYVLDMPMTYAHYLSNHKTYRWVAKSSLYAWIWIFFLFFFFRIWISYV